MDTAVKILCDVAGADAASSDVIVDRSLPVLAEVMRRDEIEDKVGKNYSTNPGKNAEHFGYYDTIFEWAKCQIIPRPNLQSSDMFIF